MSIIGNPIISGAGKPNALKIYWNGEMVKPLRQGLEATYGGSAGTVTFDTDHIFLGYTTATRWSIVLSSSKIDFTDYKTLYVEIEDVAHNVTDVYVTFGLSTTPQKAQNWSQLDLADRKNIVKLLSGTQVFNLDISNVNQECYVSVISEQWTTNYGATVQFNVKRIWAEK